MSWQERAACHGFDPIFDHTADHPSDTYAVEKAKAICYGCPVVQECLNAAMAEEAGQYLRHGVRGGLTGDERRTLHRRSVR